MRVSFFLIFLVSFTFSQGQFKRTDKVNGTFDNVSLIAIFDSLSSQTNYFFSYNSDILRESDLYTITAEDEPIDKFLSRLFIGTGLKYTFFKDQIILNYEAPQEIVKKKNFFTISGTVYDDNGKALNDVNIFLDGTSIGVYSDIDGNFKLESVPPGYYNIVFSHIGYQNGVYQIAESNGGSRIQNHQMELDLEQLDQVEVVANRIRRTEESWLAHYIVFTNELLGLTEKADDCVIENPETLNFSFNRETNVLRAFAKEPIQIRNDALGYRISYFLESFKKEADGNLRFRGKIRFRNLGPSNGLEKRTWKRNRKASYYGSFNHFKNSLLHGDLRKEGFRIYRLKNINNFQIAKENELVASDILVFKGDYYELDFKNYLIIEYKKEKESARFLRNSGAVDIFYADRIDSNGLLVKTPGPQISVMRLLRGSVRLDLSGEVMDRFGLTNFGYWSWERTGDLVPINYDPKFDNL